MTRPTRTSYSALTTFETCPLSYSLYYLDGHKTEAGAAANRGTRLHQACEMFFKDELPVERMPIDFAQVLPSLKIMKALGAKAEEVWLVDEQWNYQDEEDLFTKYKSVVDIHYLIDDVLHIIDLKTGAVYKDEHADQLQSYAIVGMSKYPHVARVEVAAMYLDGIGETQVYPRSMQPHLQRYWTDRWTKLFEAAEFPANPSPVNCKWCNYPKMGLCNSEWGRK